MSNSDKDPHGEDAIQLAPEELEVTRLILDRLKREECLESSDRETVAYRISEIMVTAKRMYTRTLPRLTNVNGESLQSMDDDMAGLQTTFLQLRDLLHDFDSTFFDSMHHERPVYDFDGEEETEEEEEAKADADADGIT